MNFDKKKIKTEVLIIGGGAGGCGTALEYAKTLLNLKKYSASDTLFSKENQKVRTGEILLVEAGKIMSATSSVHPGRAGLGFHYKHLPTAVMLLKVTLNLMLEHHPEMIGGDLPHSHPIKRGRYFIAKDSLEPPELLLKTYEELRNVYKQFSEDHPEIIDIFGKPEDFFRILDLSEYQDEVDVEKVAVAIETAEQLLDVPKFINYIKSLIKKYEINVLENCKIINLSYNQNGRGFIARSQDGLEIHASLVVNATWQNIEFLNKDLYFIRPKGHRTNRLKALAEVKVPSSLCNYSKFFCIGPFFMYSYMGKGRGLMTYAPKTNMECSAEIEVSETMKLYLSGIADENEKKKIGKEIIDGVTTYLPDMKDAQLLDVRFGIIKTYGEVDIFSHDSKFHERDDPGVEVEQLCYINNACMKFLYIFENGKIVSNLIQKHLKLQKKLFEQIDKQVSENYKNNLTYTKILKSALCATSQRYFDTKNVDINEPIKQPLLCAKIVQNKKNVNQELLKYAKYSGVFQNKSKLFNKKTKTRHDQSCVLNTKIISKRI